MNDGGAIVLNASIAGNQGISSHERLSFLASDEASYISGIELFVDGGVDKFKICINVLSESKLQAFYALTPLKNPPRCPVSIMTATPSSSIGMR